ncbi:MAG: M20/M25/M40 family metallo-hydrolase [Thermoanaerobaculum sp.]|nr:M20/M25/M40 family metallo-hydrolase [Thermoanaerobaculum sp.]
MMLAWRLTGCCMTLMAATLSAQGPSSPKPDFAALAGGDRMAFQRLTFLCDRIGPRPSWSPAYARAVQWAAEVMRQDGLENVRLQPVTVPRWERGFARLLLLQPAQREMPVVALGGSVGASGVEAPVVVVKNLEEVGPEVKGKVVVYAFPMSKPQDYGPGSRIRSQGASRAAQHGAVAVLLRSLATASLGTPHTGMLRYEEGIPPIPAAAITQEDADWLARLAAAGVEAVVRLEMDCGPRGTAVAHNVIGELRGGEKPEEVVLLGAHLDSWDVGQGAHDDGAGVVHVLEAMRLLQRTGVRPPRTVRAVLFANEEFGVDGGEAYAREFGKEKHVAAVESDMGGFAPVGWSVHATPQQMAWLWPALAATGLPARGGWGGADISPLAAQGVPLIGLVPEPSRYFHYHHTHADTLDKVDPEELQAGAVALARLAWELAHAKVSP